MQKHHKSITNANASIISMIQRFSDIFIMFIGVYAIRSFLFPTTEIVYWIIVSTTLVVFQMIGGMTDFYRSWRGVDFWDELQLLLRNWGLSIILSSGFISFFSFIDLSFYFYLAWFAITVLGFIISRATIRILLSYLRQLGYNNRNVAIIGMTTAGIHLAESLSSSPWLGFNVVGFYDFENDSSPVLDVNSDILCKGDLQDLVCEAHLNKIDRVYIALPMNQDKQIKNILSELSDTTCTVMLVPDFFTYNVLQSRSEIVNGIPVISLYETPMSGVNKILKRIEDIVFSIAILILILPVLILISVMIKMTSKGPIIFKQKRYGMDGKSILVWKFRSMSVMENGAEIVQAKKNDNRFTPIGGFLRKTSLDELPQFINVLFGDMSIVGPRPHAVAHNEQYRKLIKGYMLRHKMKPGITGWAQINGWRGETDTLDKMKKRVEYDLFYIKNWSVWFDMKIIFLTVFKGFFDKAAY